MIGVTGRITKVLENDEYDYRFEVTYDQPVWREFHLVNASGDCFIEDQLELATEPGRVTTNPYEPVERGKAVYQLNPPPALPK